MTDSARGPNEGPNERLARDIAERLVADGLVPSTRLEELTRGLADGTLGPEHWRLLVELGLDQGPPS